MPVVQVPADLVRTCRKTGCVFVGELLDGGRILPLWLDLDQAGRTRLRASLDLADQVHHQKGASPS